ncbi:MAG: tetratricopeptide repeat protein [Nitrospirota bacterium]
MKVDKEETYNYKVEKKKKIHTHLFLLAFITIVIVLIYSNTLQNEFQFDDTSNIVENTYIHIKSLSLPVLKDAAFNEAAYRRPVTNVTFALNYYFGELDVFGYHLVNIIIHIITSITIYLFLYNMLKIVVYSSPYKPFWIALIATLLWATSPVQTQAVTYIVQRATSMATMFYMLSLLCYIKGRGRVGVRSKGRLDGLLSSGCWLLASLFFAFLAFGTKEISATLPLIIILYEIYFFAKFSPVAVKKISLYFGIMLILFTMAGLLYIGTVTDGGIIESITSLIKERSIEGEEFTSVERLMTEFRVVIHYITLLVLPLPSRLRLIYKFTVSHSLFDPISTFICLSLIIGIIGYAIHISRRRPVISFFILWFFINLAIESTVIRLWLVFEHRLYLPSIGFFVIIAIGIVKLMDIVKSSRKSSIHNYLLPTTYYCFLIGIIFFQSVWTYERNFVWRNGLTLWSDNVIKSPDSSYANNNLGAEYGRMGDTNKAIELYKKAIVISPEYSEAYNNLGVIYARIGDMDKAIELYKKAIVINPEYSEAYNNLGIAYDKKGDMDKAIKLYKKAIVINPEYSEAYNNLGFIYARQKRLELAIKYYDISLKIKPDNKTTRYNLIFLYNEIGMRDKQILYFKKALELDPDNALTQNNLGLIYKENIHERVVHPRG